MNYLLILTVMVAVFVTGESLTCNTCRVGLKGRCLLGSTELCNVTESNCYQGTLAFNISTFMTLHTKGCLSSRLCNSTTSGSLLTAGYSITRTCCGMDRCNGAASAQLTLAAALLAAVSAAGTLFDTI